ncbi:hypothetical protein EXIGLDRAFT_467041 [Exidia glandulosa HHB12029]|uniref:REJ domain-containing protein n=1 Tax=Exidia glandulosa HHB12029 TaxID=1314781 RepID=A0A165JZW1_EXIGL|nr:hypothetical protein EXIGLDRAFT_467041 [Exidia glandulosa HHB12029]
MKSSQLLASSSLALVVLAAAAPQSGTFKFDPSLPLSFTALPSGGPGPVVPPPTNPGGPIVTTTSTVTPSSSLPLPSTESSLSSQSSTTSTTTTTTNTTTTSPTGTPTSTTGWGNLQAQVPSLTALLGFVALHQLLV